jgi:protein TonB
MHPKQPVQHGPTVGAQLLRLSVPAALSVAVVSVALGYWWLQRGRGAEPATVSPAVALVAGAPGETPEQAPAMLERARAALQDRRLLAPAGDNAVELYLALLARDPQQHAARQAMLELVPLAATSVKASIAAGDFAEAQRQYELVARMGAGDSLLSTLRDNLEQARSDAAELAAQAEAAALAEAQSERLAAVRPPAAADGPSVAPAAVAVARPTPVVAADQPVARPAPTPPPAEEASTAVPAEPAASSVAVAPAVQEARQIVDVRPAYPASARQRKTEGWVELEALVGSDGSVQEVAVVRSEPSRIFDREAIRAAQRWRFEPRRENGVAVESRVRKTVSFRLGTG